MKKILFTTLMFICLLLPSLSFSEEVIGNTRNINGFRGIKWGTIKADLDRKGIGWCYMHTMNEQTIAGPDYPLWYYHKDKDSDEIGAATVRDIYYGFWLRKRATSTKPAEFIFYKVKIEVEGKENWKNLHLTLRETFGPNYENMEYTKIRREWNEWIDKGVVWFISKDVEREIEEFVKEQSKKAKDDF